MRHLLFCLAFTLLPGWVLPAAGQSLFSQARFEHIGTAQGLSQSSVICLHQDAYGFIWIGTRDGLDRYNGYTFDTFRPNGSPKGLRGNHIKDIAEDKQGNLWIATQHGLSRYDYRMSEFENVALKQDGGQPVEIHALLVDRRALNAAQENNDVVAAQEILKQVFHTDVRALVAEARLRSGGALNPLQFFREEKIREGLTKERGTHTIATGL